MRAAGVEVWFDQNELVGGDAWDAKIRKQIAECALFMPILSANTQARLKGCFRIEWKLAARRTHARWRRRRHFDCRLSSTPPATPKPWRSLNGRSCCSPSEALAAVQLERINILTFSLGFIDPDYDSIRQNPRYVALLAELGLTEAHARARAWRAAHPLGKVAPRK